MSLHSHSYLSSFEILSDDFRRATEFVEPIDDNLNVYSHRLYELLLRACTDFESLCKDELIKSEYEKAGGYLNIYDYKTLEEGYKLEDVWIGILIWRPAPVYVRPFADWSTAKPPLGWYDSYNKVKHNRNTEFGKENLDNVRMALAGLFAMLVSAEILKHETGPWWQERDTLCGWFRERLFPQMIFSWAWEKGALNLFRKEGIEVLSDRDISKWL